MAESSIVNETGIQTVQVEKWVYGGEGLARIGGRVVLAPFVLPGEQAVLRLGKDMHAETLEVLKPSAHRVTPPCSLFSKCGGCDYQHAPHDFQLARKVEILQEQLARVGKIRFDGEIKSISAAPLGYRNRAQFHLQGDKIGYMAAGSHTLVPVESECPLLSPRLNQALAAMRERLSNPKFPRFAHSIELFTNEAEVQVNVLQADKPMARWFYDWCESVVALEYETAHGTFRVSPQSFFQVNRFLIDELVQAAVGDAEGEVALDLYAGVGLFTLPLSRKFKSVTAVESGIGSARDLEVNAESAGVKAVIHRERVEDFLQRATKAPDLVLCDPPRAGLGKTVVKELNRLAPPRITMVSCDPATLARDLALLKDYRIEKLILADLFPQTYHIETITQLVRI